MKLNKFKHKLQSIFITVFVVFILMGMNLSTVFADTIKLEAGYDTDNSTVELKDNVIGDIGGNEVFVARVSSISFKYYAPNISGENPDVKCEGNTINFDLNKNSYYGIDLQQKLQIPVVFCGNQPYGVFLLYMDGATAEKSGGGGWFKSGKVSGIAPFDVEIKYNDKTIGVWSFPSSGSRGGGGEIKDGKVEKTYEELKKIVQGNSALVGGQIGEIDRLLFSGTKFGISEYGVMDLGPISYEIRDIDKNVSVKIGTGFNAFPGNYSRTGKTFVRKLIPVIIKIDEKGDFKNICKRVVSCPKDNEKCKNLPDEYKTESDRKNKYEWYIDDGKCASKMTIGKLVKGKLSITVKSNVLEGNKINLDENKKVEVPGGINVPTDNVEFYDAALKGSPSSIGISSAIGNFMENNFLNNGNQKTKEFFEAIFIKIIPQIIKIGIGVLLISLMVYIFLSMVHILEPEKEQAYKKHIISIVIAGIVMTILPYAVLKVAETIRNDNGFVSILPTEIKSPGDWFNNTGNTNTPSPVNIPGSSNGQ